MSLTKPNQELRRDLSGAVNRIEEFAGELFRQAKDTPPEDFMKAMEKIESLHVLADRLRGYADEVKDSKITRE